MADNRKLYKEAVNTFGHAAQIDMMVEECAELIHAIQKFKRGRPHNAAEEIADVEIMCSQLRLIFSGVPEIKKQKLARVQRLIQSRKDAVINNG